MGVVSPLNRYSNSNSAFMSVGYCLQFHKNCSFFEGESDVGFYKPFIHDEKSSNSRFCQYLKGRGNVESGIRVYQKFLSTVPSGMEPHTKLTFCLDGDFDRLQGKNFQEEWFIYYQLWRKKNDAWLGYNDLECFLVDTKVFGYVLTNVYGVPADKVDAYRKEIVNAASCIGAFRYACRQLFRKGDEEPIFCDGDHDEMGASFFYERDWIAVGCEKISVVSDVLDQVKDWFLPKDKTCEQYGRVMEGIRLAGEIMKEPASLKYCRGHDLTELLYYLLWETVEEGPQNSMEIEKNLYALPPETAMEVRRDLVGKLVDYPIYNDFDKNLVKTITGLK